VWLTHLNRVISQGPDAVHRYSATVLSFESDVNQGAILLRDISALEMQ
jgi:hypothetical protein